MRLFLNFLFSFCFLCCASAKFSLADAQQQSGPRLSVPQRVFDFGIVQQGEIVEHRYEIFNLGDAPLRITKVHPSCGCTAAVMDSDVVEPGQKTFLKVSFDTGGFQGSKVKTVRMYTDDPAQTSFVLTLKGIVKTDLTIEPPIADFGAARSGEHRAIELNIYSEAAEPVQIKDIAAVSEGLDLAVKDSSANGHSGKKVIVTLKESVPLGVFRSRLEVKTNSSRNPVINIPVNAVVEGDLSLEPPDATFELLVGPLKQAVAKSVSLINQSEQAVSIVETKNDNPNLFVSFMPVVEGKEYRIKLELKEGTTGIIRDRVRVLTNHPDPKQVELFLPVTAIISRELNR